jgi:hypothetical protein
MNPNKPFLSFFLAGPGTSRKASPGRRSIVESTGACLGLGFWTRPLGARPGDMRVPSNGSRLNGLGSKLGGVAAGAPALPFCPGKGDVGARVG